MSKPMTPEARAEVRFPLDDDAPDFDNVLRQRGYFTAIREQVEPLEAEVAKLRELVQVLVDALEGTKSNTHWWRAHPSEEWIADAMSDAKEAGFTPTNTEDNG